MKDADWRNGRRLTLEDVARQAGVSRALVSIVMREVPGAGLATRERIKAVARGLGYRPDVRARSLASQRSGLIGVMFGVGVGSFHFDLMEALYSAAKDHGNNLILSAVTKGRTEAEAAQSLADFGFGGLIVLGPPTKTPLLAGKVPLAVIGWRVDHPQVDVVRTSDDLGMAAAVEHLAGLGHRRIAHIDGGDDLIAVARRSAYISAMHQYGLADEVSVISGGPTQLDGQRAARRLLGAGELPTALVAFNDDLAGAAMGLFAQQGVRIPEQLSVVGWDDSEAAALSPVGLTSVGQRPDVMGRLAVERMIARVEQRRVENREIVLEPVLRIRESTAKPVRSMS